MSSEIILLIAGDGTLGKRVSQLLDDHGIAVQVVDPEQVDVTPETLFDAAFDNKATAVVLIEALPRQGNGTVRSSDDLVAAALRAARSPTVTGFGWVTSGESTDALSDFRSRGKPYGVLRPPALLEVEVDEDVAQASGKPVLIDAAIALQVAEEGALPIEDAAQNVVAWIERGGMRGGGQDKLEGSEHPLEYAIRGLGYEPRVVARWRVNLKGVFGTTAIDRDGDRWRIRQKSWFRKTGSGAAMNAQHRESPG